MYIRTQFKETFFLEDVTPIKIVKTGRFWKIDGKGRVLGYYPTKSRALVALDCIESEISAGSRLIKVNETPTKEMFPPDEEKFGFVAEKFLAEKYSMYFKASDVAVNQNDDDITADITLECNITTANVRPFASALCRVKWDIAAEDENFSLLSDNVPQAIGEGLVKMALIDKFEESCFACSEKILKVYAFASEADQTMENRRVTDKIVPDLSWISSWAGVSKYRVLILTSENSLFQKVPESATYISKEKRVTLEINTVLVNEGAPLYAKQENIMFLCTGGKSGKRLPAPSIIEEAYGVYTRPGP